MKNPWKGLSIAEMHQLIGELEQTPDFSSNPIYVSVCEGYDIVTTPEFEYLDVNGDGVRTKVQMLTPEQRRQRRIYYRNRQNGRGRNAIPFQMIVEALKEHEALYLMRKEREKTNFDRTLSNLDKLWLLDPENQEF